MATKLQRRCSGAQLFQPNKPVKAAPQAAARLTCSKALVGHVKEWHVALGLAQVSYLLPLLRGGVNTRRIVCATCEKGQQAHMVVT